MDQGVDDRFPKGIVWNGKASLQLEVPQLVISFQPGGHVCVGSYGELISVTLPKEALKKAADKKTLIIRLSVDEALPGGLAIYGERFGRYPLDPTLIFTLRK